MESSGKSVHTGLLERMQRRHEELEEKSRQRRQQREEQEGLSGSAAADHFLKTFQQLHVTLKGRIEAAENVSESELTQYLDDLVKGVQELQDLLNDSSRHLASFQQKKAQKEVNEASALVQAAVTTLQPKKKFGFGRKKPSGKSAAAAAAAPKKQPSQESPAGSVLDALDGLANRQFFGFKDESGRTLTLTPEELLGRQLNLQNLVECRVLALGSPGTLQAAGLERCTVLVGPAARSAFIKDCHHCTFVLAGQQMRIHNTTDTDLYIHVTGAAIIEGCRDMRVAPYTLTYPALDQHYLITALDRNTNRWDQLDDFDWLNENEASPNWSVIPEGERHSDWLSSTSSEHLT